MQRILNGFLLVGFLLTVSGLSYFLLSQPKTGYVDINKIYNDFDLKKELESKLKNVQQARKIILDSLGLKINLLSNAIKLNKSGEKEKAKKIEEYEAKRTEYLYKEKAFKEDNDRTSQQYSDQIWKQINQYVGDYGKEHSYTYIFGADGSGGMMYASEKSNITEEIKGYVNSKYKNK